MAMQATHAATGALCVTDRASVKSKFQSKSALTDFGLQPYSHMLF